MSEAQSNFGLVADLSMSPAPHDPEAPYKAIVRVDGKMTEDGGDYCDFLFEAKYSFKKGAEMGPLPEAAQRISDAMELAAEEFGKWGYDTVGHSSHPDAMNLNPVLHREVDGITHGRALRGVLAMAGGVREVFNELISQMIAYGDKAEREGMTGHALEPVPDGVVDEAPPPAPESVVTPAPEVNASAAENPTADPLDGSQ